jgi:hypothetical protein
VHAAQCDVSYPVPRSQPLPPSIPPSLPPSGASLPSLTLLPTRDCPSEPPLRTHAARTPTRLVDLIAPARAQPAEVRARADGRQASAQTTLGRFDHGVELTRSSNNVPSALGCAQARVHACDTRAHACAHAHMRYGLQRAHSLVRHPAAAKQAQIPQAGHAREHGHRRRVRQLLAVAQAQRLRTRRTDVLAASVCTRRVRVTKQFCAFHRIRKPKQIHTHARTHAHTHTHARTRMHARAHARARAHAHA